MTNKRFQSHWLEVGVLLLVLALAFSVRLYKLTTPLADWHSWRQADTASVTREFVKHGYPIWQPHYHDLSNIPSGLENPEGWRMVEFPLVNFFVAQYLLLDTTADLVVASRFASIFLSLISIAALFGIVRTAKGSLPLATLAAVLLAVLPYNIYYSRVILPEPGMIAFQLTAVWAFMRYSQAAVKKSPLHSLIGWYALTVLSLALSLLLKPTAIFIAPVFIAITWYFFKFSAIKRLELWLLPILVFSPLVFWRWWIHHYPQGIPASSWLLNGNGIRLRPSWWRWLFADRIAAIMLGYWGVAPLVLGLISRFKSFQKGSWALLDLIGLSWAAGMVAYLVVFATGNVQHDYYQAMLAPCLTFLVAKGVHWAWTLPTQVSYTWITRFSLVAVTLLGLGLSWYQVRGYYQINNPAIVAAGQAVDVNTPEDALVIAPYDGDTAFLFQTNRLGWPIHGLVEQRIEQGATHYVTTALTDEAKQLQAKYQTLKQTDQYLLLDLSKPSTPAGELRE